MTVSAFDWQRRTFLDIEGSFRVIQGCSLLALDELADMVELLNREIAQSPPGESFDALYRRSLMVRETCHHCLRLCGIDPAWLNLDMMVHLLHHYEVDGQIHQGALIEMNFPDKGQTTVDAGVTLKEYVATAIASLWGQSGDLAKALSVAESVPADKLEAIMKARQHQLDPKAKAKADSKARLEELAKKEVLSDENLFNFDFSNLKPPTP